MNIAPTCSAPTKVEMTNRLERVQARMAELALDYYVCHEPSNIFYLTNFANFVHERPFIVLVPASGKLIFIMPVLEREHVQSRSVGDIELIQYKEFPAPDGERWSDRLSEILKSNSHVGLGNLCPLALAKAIPSSTITCDLVDDIRMIKSEYEINRIAYTCELLTAGHAQLLSEVKIGQLPILLYKSVSSALTQKLLLDNPQSNLLNSKFNAVTQLPQFSHDPHNFSDIFSALDVGGPNVTIVNGLANGYGAELERTFFLDTVPEVAKKPFNTMLEARELAYKLTVPDANMADVDRQVNNYMKSQGYADNLLHRTGHGFGVTDHEGPFLAEGYDRNILPNMVFSIEPGIYLPGIGGFRFSDTVLVTEGGNQKLTCAPETLEELTLPGN